MAGRDGPGPFPQSGKRAEFTRLIRLGVPPGDACRQVGINRKTGFNWRVGRTITASGGESRHYPPVMASEFREISARFLSEKERCLIADLRRGGATLRQIADELARSPSTISRELRRNTEPAAAVYRPAMAHRLAAARRSARRGRRVERDTVLCSFIQERLAERFSPEQIAHELREQFPGDRPRQLVPESIYQAVYDTHCVLTRDRPLTLRTRRFRRRAHRRGDTRRAGGLPQPMALIDSRPATVTDRVEPGHWEGDYIVGLRNESAIATLVERSSRYVVLVHLDGDKSSVSLRDRLIEVFTTLPAGMAKTLTWDQGKEMSTHLEVSRATGIGIYFAHPHSPWERGSNENMNGLVRDYFPKRTDLRVHTAADLLAVANQLNRRPRKTLDWARPADLFNRHATSTDAMPSTSGLARNPDPNEQLASPPLVVLRP